MSISMNIPNFPVQCTFLAFNDPTVTSGGFWCSESGQNVNLTRQWVQEWELFKIVEDSFTGASMLMSNQTRKYISVSDDGGVRCVEAQSTRETHLTLNETVSGRVTVKATNGRYLKTDPASRQLRADGTIPYEFDMFRVAVVAICKYDDINDYATPRHLGGRNVVCMDSKTPNPFYLLFLGDSTSQCYLETANYEFLNPSNSVEPVSYDRLPYDRLNFRMRLEAVAGEDNAFTIKGEATGGNELNWQASSQWANAIFCDGKGGASTKRFRIVAAR